MAVNQVVERWKADEATVRARLRDSDAAPQEQVAGRSGMEIFEGIFAGEPPSAPIGDTLDFVPIHIAPGEEVFQGRPKRFSEAQAAGKFHEKIVEVLRSEVLP